MRSFGIHSLSWIFVLSVFYLFSDQVLGENFAGLENFAVFAFFTILIYYFNIKLLFPKYLGFKDQFYYKMLVLLFVEYILLTLVLIIISISIGNLQFKLSGSYFRLLITNYFHIGFLFFHGVFLSGLSYIFYWSINQKVESKKDKQSINLLKRDKEIIRQDWLKAQLDPHLLSNILPLLEYTIEHEPKEASKALSLLNNIMLYYLRKAKEGLIPLVDEIEQARNHIALHSIRNAYKSEIVLEVSGACKKVYILPQAILLLVENIVKYGELDDVHHPAVVKVKVTDDAVLIEAKNKINGKHYLNSTKVGIRNLKERLKHFYPQEHSLEIETSNAEYSIRIELAIKQVPENAQSHLLAGS